MRECFRDILCSYAKVKKPFLFIVDFLGDSFYIKHLSKISTLDVLYKVGFDKNFSICDTRVKQIKKDFYFKKYPISFKEYKKKFDLLLEQMKMGNTYIINLTFPTKIVSSLSLRDIFFISDAKFKICFEDKFVCFSPETFLSIRGNHVKTFPMKGTIDANLKNAKYKLLSSKKEFCEHSMIVDLLRNDLSMVSKNVTLNKFRHIFCINAGDNRLLQTISTIDGILDNRWEDRLGDIMFSLLPAGSISGVPKKKSLDIIKDIENKNRNFFTGIFGIYKPDYLEVGVMIRFIEKNKNSMFYRSGGGITIDSNPKKEYEEMIEKVYVPTL